MHDLWSARLTVIFFEKSPDREASRTQEKLGQNVLLLLLLHVTVLSQYGDCIHGESERGVKYYLAYPRIHLSIVIPELSILEMENLR